MTGRKGNSEFCFPETLNEHFPCFVIPPDSKIEKTTTKWFCWCLYIRWLRSQTSGSQTRAVVPKRHDNNLFLRSWQKIKTALKFLLLFLMLNSRILGLIWRGTAYFVVNNTTIFLPGDSDRRVSCRTRATHFWRQIKSLEIVELLLLP